MMDASTEKKLRLRTLLRYLETAYPAGLTLRAISDYLGVAGHTVTDDRLVQDLQALMQKGDVRQVADPFSPALKYYYLTDQGIAAL